MRNHKIRVFKWSDSWAILCPRCIYSRSFVAMASTYREAISKAHKHLRTRHTTHRAYIAWPRIAGEPVARCHDCTWHTTATPFQAAAEHLRETRE